MNDLVAFLNARLNEDEAAALGTCTSPQIIGRHRGKPLQRWRATESGRGITDMDGGRLHAKDVFPAEIEHIIRHDVVRVLAEVDAKRRIISWHDGQRDDTTPRGKPVVICYCGYDQPCATLRLLALPYADHPDYREEWRP